MKTSDLRDKGVAEEFYEQRYQDGYMDEWPQWKKDRIIALLKSMKLPGAGNALDFGCGNGVFTGVLKTALPGWEIYGSDISETALQNARKRFPDCKFSTLENLISDNFKAELIFSHHVLEHVFDLPGILKEMVKTSADNGRMFHIMPCGNEGSFEYQLASAVKNGIDPAVENRFYYEDKGHLRRLKSAELDHLVKPFGFIPEKAWFSNQHWGSLDWMSQYSDEFINDELTPLDNAKDEASKKDLRKLRSMIMRLKTAKRLAQEGLKHQIKQRLIELKKNPLKIFGIPGGILSDRRLVLEGKAFNENLAREWESRSESRDGSEMYLLYRKS